MWKFLKWSELTPLPALFYFNTFASLGLLLLLLPMTTWGTNNNTFVLLTFKPQTEWEEDKTTLTASGSAGQKCPPETCRCCAGCRWRRVGRGARRVWSRLRTQIKTTQRGLRVSAMEWQCDWRGHQTCPFHRGLRWIRRRSGTRSSPRTRRRSDKASGTELVLEETHRELLLLLLWPIDPV